MAITVNFTGLYLTPKVTPSSSSPTSLVVTVPRNALAGPIYVVKDFVPSTPYFFTRVTRGGLHTPWGSSSTPVSDIVNIAIMPNNHWFLADLRGGFWRSPDQGATWSLINGAIPARTLSYGPGGVLIFYDAQNVQLIAGTDNPAAFYRSSNEGATWTLIPSAVAAQVGFSGGVSVALPCTNVAVSPSGNIVMAFQLAYGPIVSGTTTLLPSVCYSTDGGATTILSTFTAPTHITAGYSFPNDVRVVIYNPITSEFWLGSASYGPFRSIDDGATWLPTCPGFGFFPTNISGMTYDASGNILCTTDNGVMKSSLSGGVYTWTQVQHTSEYRSGEQFFTMGRDSSNNLYFGNDPTPNPFNPSLELLGSIYRSTNGGATWAPYDGTNPAYTGTSPGAAGNQFAASWDAATADFSQPASFAEPTCYRILQNPSDGKMYALVSYRKDENPAGLVNGCLAEIYSR